MPGGMLRKRTRDDGEQCDELQAEQEEANAADAASAANAVQVAEQVFAVFCSAMEGAKAGDEDAAEAGLNAGENDFATDAKECGAEDEVVGGGSSEGDGESSSEGDGESGSEESGSGEDSESSSEGDGDSSKDEDPFLGDCECLILGREFDDVLEDNKRYTALLNREDYTAFRNAGMELLGPFYSVLMAECIGSPPAFLLAIKTAAQTAAVNEIQKTALSQPRLALLKEAVSLAVYNYACSKTPKKHPLTGRKNYFSHLFATTDFQPGCNSLV